MTKAMLSRRGVEFDAFDVENDPEAARALRELGFSSVPVVIVGDRSMAGWNPTKLAELVGFALEEHVSGPDELLARIRVILDAAQRAVRQVPDDAWERMAPGRNRPLRELARHLFQVIEVSVDADLLGTFSAREWLAAKDIPSLNTGARLSRYGEAARARFEAWYGAAPPDPSAFARVLAADVGPRTLEQVLQRTCLHAAQHLRQLYAFHAWLGVVPDRPLSDEALLQMGLTDLPDELF
jgi:glutaredoxin